MRLKKTLADALALFLWRFPENALLLLLPTLLGMGIKYYESNPPSYSLLSYSLLMGLYLLLILFINLEVVRRLLNLPFHLGWLLKRACVAFSILCLMYFTGLLCFICYGMLSQVLPWLHQPLPALIFSSILALVLLSRIYLLLFPRLLQENTSLIETLRRNMKIPKPQRAFVDRISVIWFLFAMTQAYLYLFRFFVTSNQIKSILIPSLLGLLMQLWLLCLQTATYRQLPP